MLLSGLAIDGIYSLVYVLYSLVYLFIYLILALKVHKYKKLQM